MIVFSFNFGSLFIRNCECTVACFLSIDLVVAIVMRVSIYGGEMKTFEKSHRYSRKQIHQKLKNAAPAI